MLKYYNLQVGLVVLLKLFTIVGYKLGCVTHHVTEMRYSCQT